MGFFSNHKSSPTRGWALLPTGLYIFTPGHAHQLTSSGWQVGWFVLFGNWNWIWIWRHRNWTGFGDTGIEPAGSIYDQRKIPLHHFTIGFQKPGICVDSFSLIIVFVCVRVCTHGVCVPFCLLLRLSVCLPVIYLCVCVVSLSLSVFVCVCVCVCTVCRAKLSHTRTTVLFCGVLQGFCDCNSYRNSVNILLGYEVPTNHMLKGVYAY